MKERYLPPTLKEAYKLRYSLEELKQIARDSYDEVYTSKGDDKAEQ